MSDGIFDLMKQEPVNAFYMTGKFHDCGGKLGYMKAVVEYSMRHSTESEAFSEWEKSLNLGRRRNLRNIATGVVVRW